MKRPLSLTLTLALLAAASACGTESDGPDAGARAASEQKKPAATESAAPQPRLAVAYDGGVLVVDAEDGTVLEDLEQPGFVRVRDAGDGRHVLIARTGGFAALDLGAWTDGHGDHGHSWTVDPHLTGTEFAAVEPGHVVSHDGRTVLFDDGTGEITSFATADLAEGDPVETREWKTPAAHHGVAVERADGALLHTLGDETSRSGVAVVARGKQVAASDDCPGVHGEAFAGDTGAFGCEDGMLLVDGRTFRKVSSPDAYGRIGNQAASEHSPVLLGDYKVDKDAEVEHPTRVSLIDTRKATLRLVDLGTSYTFRSLGRGPAGEALVLGTDGALHVIDPASGKVTRRIDVVAPWEEPVEWQSARPALLVLGATAYVTEPATREVHVVDLASGRVRTSYELPQVPNELAGTAG